jgi:hypothetical protein
MLVGIMPFTTVAMINRIHGPENIAANPIAISLKSGEAPSTNETIKAAKDITARKNVQASSQPKRRSVNIASELAFPHFEQTVSGQVLDEAIRVLAPQALQYKSGVLSRTPLPQLGQSSLESRIHVSGTQSKWNQESHAMQKCGHPFKRPNRLSEASILFTTIALRTEFLQTPHKLSSLVGSMTPMSLGKGAVTDDVPIYLPSFAFESD